MAVRGDQLFLAGGECDPRTINGRPYMHYPKLAVAGTISLAGHDTGHLAQLGTEAPPPPAPVRLAWGTRPAVSYARE